MIRREVAYHLQMAGYEAELPRSPDTHWRHPSGKFTVQIRYGGSVIVWYHQHPKHWCWDGYRFINRDDTSFTRET